MLIYIKKKTIDLQLTSIDLKKTTFKIQYLLKNLKIP